MRSYRRAQRVGKEQRNTSAVVELLLDRVKNNLDSDLTLWTGKVCLVGGNRVKNILARADLLVIAGLTKSERPTAL
jgi:hypothetical protein